MHDHIMLLHNRSAQSPVVGKQHHLDLFGSVKVPQNRCISNFRLKRCETSFRSGQVPTGSKVFLAHLIEGHTVDREVLDEPTVIHRELVARFQSVRYLHVTQEYNASADSLAGETLAAKEAKTTLTEGSKSKLEQLNRIHDVIYGESSRETTKKRVRFADTPDEASGALPVEPEPPDRPNDASTESSHVENGENFPEAAERPPNAEDVVPLEVQEERRRRFGMAQDEELRWANLKLVLKGESSSLGYKAAQEAWKMADRFVLNDDGLLYSLGKNRPWGKNQMNETVPRLVVPTTMVQEVLQSCHDSLEGGHQGIVRTFHRVKVDYYWIGPYADVEKHVRSCPDYSSSKGRPQLRGYFPGNILAERSLQIVSMDFVIPLPKRFGAPSLVRHGRDPRFMSEVFQAFAEMMQSRSRATLSHWPQVNGHQERSVKTVMQSVRVYAEDPLQQDWDEIVEKLVFAINNSQDTTHHSERNPFYLVHGWDAQTTPKAMASS
ncbi:unnamed protein product [Phytophthora fragariaefolia]|uniref:Unnamed protein product n=1 Tax=Phytophthora fragariaefolia TaxID=1490495 RepID=A0A9W6Y8X8_9STRA|nr:unnamed protein product [Phytophthora fragariaefolia]